MPANERIVRVCRVIMIQGPEEWVNATLAKSYLKPQEPTYFGNDALKYMNEVTRIREVVDAS